MPAEKIHRKPSAKACFGNPPDSEWYKGIHEGRYPAPDVQLGPCTPGWTDGHIARHQEVMRHRGPRAPQCNRSPRSPWRTCRRKQPDNLSRSKRWNAFRRSGVRRRLRMINHQQRNGPKVGTTGPQIEERMSCSSKYRRRRTPSILNSLAASAASPLSRSRSSSSGRLRRSSRAPMPTRWRPMAASQNISVRGNARRIGSRFGPDAMFPSPDRR
jgi:hypothetical protein